MEPATLAQLRRSIERSIAAADALNLPLVAIWLEHARQETGPWADGENDADEDA